MSKKPSSRCITFTLERNGLQIYFRIPVSRLILLGGMGPLLVVIAHSPLTSYLLTAQT